jgi:hypothetical protein
MRRRLTSWLGLFLLLFDVLAGGAMPGARTAVGLTDPDLTYTGIPQDICTRHHGAADGQPDHSSGGEHGGMIFCAFCLPLMHAGIDLPPVATTDLPVTWHRENVAPPVEHRVVLSAHLQSSASPRAPPAA